MEKSTANGQQAQGQAIESISHRRYHDGLPCAKEPLLRLLSEEMPPLVVLERYRVFALMRRNGCYLTHLWLLTLH